MEPVVVSIGNLMFVLAPSGMNTPPKFLGLALFIDGHLNVVEGDCPDGRRILRDRRSMR